MAFYFLMLLRYNDFMEQNRPLSQLQKELFDILIIGGGINGAGIARDAALRGFKVALIEQGDFASGTSSKTSKLAHGGLRYLEQGHFKLVHESLEERYHLLKMAPHLVHPLSFLLPIYEHQSPGSLKIRIGLSLYDRLAGRHNIHPHETFSQEKIQREIPSLQQEKLKRVFHFYDAQMNDARICLENILSAVEKGALCLNYFKALELTHTIRRISGVQAQDLISGRKIQIQAKMVVNATGPWTDQLLKAYHARPRLRLTKGIHLVLPRLADHHAFLFTTARDGRVFFCIPWRHYSLVGTTDTDFSGPSGPVTAEPEDVLYLLEEIQRFFPRTKIAPRDVISTFAGLRPLVFAEGRKASQVSREYRIEETFPGLLSILGGKFTTYRSLAEKVVDQITQTLHLHENEQCQSASIPLPGAEKDLTAEILSKESGLPLEKSAHLIGHYGSRAIAIARTAKETGLDGQLCPHHLHLKAEVLYAFTHEMAQTLDDFFTRRTFIRHSICRGLDCLENAARVLLELSVFTSEELEEQKKDYRDKVEKDLSAIRPV